MTESLMDVYNEISIQQYKTDMGFKALVEGVQDNIFVIPEYQRKYRWKKYQVEELASSLIRDLPIPPIYTYRNQNGQLEILDGQQRIMSLYFYFIGKFFKNANQAVFDYSDLEIESNQNFEEALEKKYKNIVSTKFYMTLGNKKYDISYDTLPLKLQRKIDYRTISIVEIKTSELELRDATLHKIFINLNNGGEQLSKQEFRNGIYPCNFNRMIKTFNDTNAKWRDLYGKVDEKCKDIESLYYLCTLKMFAEYDGNDFMIRDYRRKEKFIDYFSDKACYLNDFEIDQYRECLNGFINKLNISKDYFRKKYLLEGLFVVWNKTAIQVPESGFTDEICKKISEDAEIKKMKQEGTNSAEKMTKRWKRIYEILSGDDR